MTRARISLMRQRTCRTVLDPLARIGIRTPAFRAKRIERAVAKQAIKLIGVYALMTGKVLARPMRKERIFMSVLLRHLPVFQLSCQRYMELK